MTYNPSPVPEAALPAMRPTVRFMLAHPAHLVAFGFGSGLSRIAPGTVGTLWAWLAYAVLQAWLPPAGIALVIGLSLPLGWWACTRTAQHMQVQDSGHIVWDEVLGFWLVLWLLMPADLASQTAAFLLFRVLDAVKPGPIGWADRRFDGFGWRGGFGILFDDLVAAFCTLLVFAIWRTW